MNKLKSMYVAIQHIYRVAILKTTPFDSDAVCESLYQKLFSLVKS